MQPNYDSYVPNILINGAKPVYVDLDLPGYTVNWQKVANAVTPKTKAIIINSPHNPTGSVLSAEDIQQLRKVVEGTNIFIVSDEVYEHIIFDEVPHQSILRYPDLYERSFVCFSFGKVISLHRMENWILCCTAGAHKRIYSCASVQCIQYKFYCAGCAGRIT